MKTLAITEAILSLTDVEFRFGVKRIENPDFFAEWQQKLPELTILEKEMCDRIRKSYLYNRTSGMLESAVNLTVISPLMYLAGYFDPPYRLETEVPVEVIGEDEGVVYRGRIDALVLQHSLWIVVLESKGTKFNFFEAVPQALTYMMGSPNLDKPIFGMVTNGDGFLFIKLQKEPVAEYDFSTDFSLFGRPHNELYQVLQVMKRLGQSLLKQ
jgi:hypothetical protein